MLLYADEDFPFPPGVLTTLASTDDPVSSLCRDSDCLANVRGSPAKRRAVYRTAYSSGARRFGRCNRLLASTLRTSSCLLSSSTLAFIPSCWGTDLFITLKSCPVFSIGQVSSTSRILSSVDSG